MSKSGLKEFETTGTTIGDEEKEEEVNEQGTEVKNQ